MAVITVIGVSMIIFVAARLSGDVALLLASEDATDEEIQTIRIELGLDKPVPVQYYIFVKNALQGDFGQSTRYNQPAIKLVLNRIPATLELGFTGFAMALILGIIFGTISTIRRGGLFDWAGKIFAMLGQSMPGFWTGIMLILLFGVYLGWLPTSGRGGIQHLIMPAFSMGWYSISAIMRLTRSSMLDVMDSEYIKMARIKGNPERVVIWKHALRNALIPIVSLAGFQLAVLIGGTAVIESVFRWPGVGSLMIDAIFNRDYAVIQAGALIVCTTVVIVNLFIDLLYGVINPRIQYE